MTVAHDHEQQPATPEDRTPALGGHWVAETLRQAGVRHVFGLHGGHLEAVFQGCVLAGIDITDVRDEAAAGHAAEGYARAGRTLGVALATAGPGITNIITSIANARSDRTPVLYVTASEAMTHVATNMMQGDIDNVALARPVTKWAHRVTVAADIPRMVAHAIRVATAAPAGPVLLDFPVDVLFAPVDEPLPSVIETPGPEALPAPQAATVASALELLATAQRPVLLAGEGAAHSGAEAELRALAEAAGLPVYTHNNAHGLLPSDHDLHAGTFFRLAEMTAAETRPDVVLAVGVRFGAFTLAQSERVVPTTARVIHVEADPVEIGRLRRADLAMVADSRTALAALADGAAGMAWPDRSAWLRTIATARERRRERQRATLQQSTSRIHPLRIAQAIVEAADDDTILVGDGAETQEWLMEMAAQRRPRSYFGAGQLGCLGYGLGFAIGVQVQRPERRVVLVTGDGGVGFTIAELDTMARHRLPIVVVVFNNRAWGATRHFQALFSGEDHHVATELADTRYDLVAEGFGCRGAWVREPGELGPALRAALGDRGPTCINVATEFGEPPPDELLLLTSF